MQVRDIMSRQVELVNPDNTLQEAAQIMQQKHIGALPVGENDRLVGMLTDRDIAVRSTANGNDPKSTHVRDIMTENIEFCFEDDDLDRIRRKMTNKKIRRLMVMNHDKRMTGILSLGDIASETDDHELSGDILHDVSSGKPV